MDSYEEKECNMYYDVIETERLVMRRGYGCLGYGRESVQISDRIRM